MDILKSEQWNYQLAKEGDAYYLSVLCGTAGMYEIEMRLTEDEIHEYEKEGIGRLVLAVRAQPERYLSRRRQKGG